MTTTTKTQAQPGRLKRRKLDVEDVQDVLIILARDLREEHNFSFETARKNVAAALFSLEFDVDPHPGTPVFLVWRLLTKDGAFSLPSSVSEDYFDGFHAGCAGRFDYDDLRAIFARLGVEVTREIPF